MISQEYVLSVGIMLGVVLKAFGIDIENGVIEGGVVFVAALWIAIRRRMKGDLKNSVGGLLFGVKK